MNPTATLAAGVALALVAAAGPATAAGALEALTVTKVRAIVISPHPDDATLAAGGLMQRIIQRGGTVHVVQMTGGDGFPKGVTTLTPGLHPTPTSYRLYGDLREREAIRALRTLGVHRSRIRLLGFPDEGLCLLAEPGSGEPLASPYTLRQSPPVTQQIIPGAMYRHDDVLSELTRLIEDVRPTLIVLPHSGDEHPDHCATHLLVHQALAAAVADGISPPRLLHYILHYPSWPAADGGEATIAPPSAGHASDWTWMTFPLRPAEQAAKNKALDFYRSQMLVMPEFMKAFERTNELFLEGEPASPFPCWCNGENIAAAATGK